MSSSAWYFLGMALTAGIAFHFGLIGLFKRWLRKWLFVPARLENLETASVQLHKNQNDLRLQMEAWKGYQDRNEDMMTKIQGQLMQVTGRQPFDAETKESIKLFNKTLDGWNPRSMDRRIEEMATKVVLLDQTITDLANAILAADEEA